MRDTHYLTGLVDGLTMAQRIEKEHLDAVISRLHQVKAGLVYDMYIGPSDTLRCKLLELDEIGP